jgi:hypothetical protein
VSTFALSGGSVGNSHSVGFSVDEQVRCVDDMYPTPPVHRTVTVRGMTACLSSTASSTLDANVHRSFEGLSPVSTAAKTMDDNLISIMGNDKSYNLVEIGDIPRLPVSDGLLTSTDGGTR